MVKPLPPEVLQAAAQAIKMVGGAELGRRVGVTRFAVSQWKASGIPAVHVGRVSSITGMKPHELRPDLFEAASPASAACPPTATTEAAA